MCMCICRFDFLWLLQDGLVETLRRTRLKFVHCFLPHHNAALSEAARSGTLKSNSSLTGSNLADDLLINVPLLRSQVSNGSHLIYGSFMISLQSVANHQKFKSPGMWQCHWMSSSQSLEDSGAFIKGQTKQEGLKHKELLTQLHNVTSQKTVCRRHHCCENFTSDTFYALPVYVCKQKCFYLSVLLIL